MRLAFVGSMNDEILNTDELCLELIRYLLAHYPDACKNRYEADETDAVALMQQIAVNRKCFSKGEELDMHKTSHLVLDDFRSGRLGKITLESPEELA